MKAFLVPVFGFLVFAFTAPAQIKLAALAPDFSLVSCEGQTVKLSAFKGKTVVLEWFNYGCPFVHNHYATGALPALQTELTGRGVVWLTIVSTHPGHENYLPAEKLAAQAKKIGMKSTALLPDPEGAVGRLYGAKTTPHMFVIDAAGRVAYQGALDDRPATSGDPSTAKNYVRAAVEELLEGKAVALPQTKAYGCSVKYAK